MYRENPLDEANRVGTTVTVGEHAVFAGQSIGMQAVGDQPVLVVDR